MKWFYNLKVKTKIMMSASYVALITIIIGSISYATLSQVDNNTAEFLNKFQVNLKVLKLMQQSWRVQKFNLKLITQKTQ